MVWFCMVWYGIHGVVLMVWYGVHGVVWCSNVQVPIPWVWDEESLTKLRIDNLPRWIDFNEVVHGTQLRHYESICRIGLKAGGLQPGWQNPRSHIHRCIPDPKFYGQVKSGYPDLPTS